MEKDIVKRGRTENRVLYEQSEPLFPPLMKNERYRRAKMILCAAVAVALVVGGALWAINVFSEDGGNGKIPDGFATRETDVPTETETPEKSESESLGESQTHDSSSGEESDTAIETAPEIFAETDISESDKGDEYVINYTSKKLDVQGLLHRGFVYSEQSNSQAPLVMVIHTHTGEKYLGEGEDALGLGSVVSVGEGIVARLNALGLSAIHCTVIHDEGEENAYLAARQTIKTMLEIYPSIKYVIDVHRMSLEGADGAVLATKLTGDGEAQMRISVSTDQKREGDWQDDLCLALALRSELNASQSNACAPVTVRGGGYNGDLCRFYLTLDVGAQGNGVDTAIAAGESFAEALADIVLRR